MNIYSFSHKLSILNWRYFIVFILIRLSIDQQKLTIKVSIVINFNPITITVIKHFYRKIIVYFNKILISFKFIAVSIF